MGSALQSPSLEHGPRPYPTGTRASPTLQLALQSPSATLQIPLVAFGVPSNRVLGDCTGRVSMPRGRCFGTLGAGVGRGVFCQVFDEGKSGAWSHKTLTLHTDLD